MIKKILIGSFTVALVYAALSIGYRDAEILGIIIVGIVFSSFVWLAIVCSRDSA